MRRVEVRRRCTSLADALPFVLAMDDKSSLASDLNLVSVRVIGKSLPTPMGGTQQLAYDK